MQCTRCGLFNPPSAIRCDCGFDFESGTVKQSYLNAVARPPVVTDTAAVRSLWAAILIFIVVLRVASPPKPGDGHFFFSASDIIGLLVWVGAPPLAWAALGAALLHATLATRSAWWLHHASLALMGGVLAYTVLFADYGGVSIAADLAESYGDFRPDGFWWWVPLQAFVVIGATAAVAPIVGRRYRRRGRRSAG